VIVPLALVGTIRYWFSCK